MNEKRPQQIALDSLNRDYKAYTEKYEQADNREQRARQTDATASEHRDLAGRAGELYVDPEWQGRAGSHATVDSFREDLAADAASFERHAKRQRRNADTDRRIAENVILANTTEHYQSNPDAFYHAAVADAHMQGIHIKSGEQPEYAVDVRPIPPTE